MEHAHCAHSEKQCANALEIHSYISYSVFIVRVSARCIHLDATCHLPLGRATDTPGHGPGIRTGSDSIWRSRPE